MGGTRRTLCRCESEEHGRQRAGHAEERQQSPVGAQLETDRIRGSRQQVDDGGPAPRAHNRPSTLATVASKPLSINICWTTRARVAPIESRSDNLVC